MHSILLPYSEVNNTTCTSPVYSYAVESLHTKVT